MLTPGADRSLAALLLGRGDEDLCGDEHHDSHFSVSGCIHLGCGGDSQLRSSQRKEHFSEKSFLLKDL